ncbi:MAG: hypothetical protein OEZ30_09960 [Candidatus Aminicenantes bacterium]|nr:hypothetical protein [Candidatus Aminicenantes bacterium]MDH5715877.1 hypothetical protein [Candidatus Aminicenantes bacterium]
MKFKLFTCGLLLMALFCFSGLISADTIYLKNGKKIQTSWVETKGDKVNFLKYGGIVTIPLAKVERIVPDFFEEKSIDRTASVPETAEQVAPPPEEALPEEEEEEIPEEEMLKRTPQYWIERRAFLNEQIQAKEEQIWQLQINVQGAIATGISTIPLAEKIMQLEEEIAQMREELANLEFEAKRYGIRPGELRGTPPPR